MWAMKRRNCIGTATVLWFGVITTGCKEKQDLMVQGEERQEIRLVADSPAVRRLISDEEKVEKAVLDSWQKNSKPGNAEQQLNDVAAHPERYTPGRKNFLTAMQQQPAVVVHGQVHFEVVDTSLAACTLTPFATENFVSVRMLEGPDRGKEGWLCSDKISVNDGRNSVFGQDTAAPPIKTTLCELGAHPEKYVGRFIEIRAAVEQGFEISLLVDNSCSARIWFDTVSGNFDEEYYRRMEAYLSKNNRVGTVVGRFDHVGWFSLVKGHGFGHLGQWQSQLVMQSFKGI
jgi:hypothetical protein